MSKTLDAISRFFTFKTDMDLHKEECAAEVRARTLATPHGLRSFIGDQQKIVDTMKSNTEAFLTDIENHFGDAAKYLTPAYTGRTKFENIEELSRRRIGVKWVDRIYSYDDCILSTIGFVYTETVKGVRLDYVKKTISGAKEVVNDNYDPETDKVYKTQHAFDDDFRSVRRYASHDDFVSSGDKPPKWFIEALSHRTPTV